MVKVRIKGLRHVQDILRETIKELRTTPLNALRGRRRKIIRRIVKLGFASFDLPPVRLFLACEFLVCGNDVVAMDLLRSLIRSFDIEIQNIKDFRRQEKHSGRSL